MYYSFHAIWKINAIFIVLRAVLVYGMQTYTQRYFIDLCPFMNRSSLLLCRNIGLSFRNLTYIIISTHTMHSLHVLASLLPLTGLAAVIPVPADPADVPAVVVGAVDTAAPTKAVAVPVSVPETPSVIGAVVPATPDDVPASGKAVAVPVPVKPSGVIAAVVPTAPDEGPATGKAVAVPVHVTPSGVIGAVVPTTPDDIPASGDAVAVSVPVSPSGLSLVVPSGPLDPLSIVDAAVDASPASAIVKAIAPGCTDIGKCAVLPARLTMCTFGNAVVSSGLTISQQLQNCGLDITDVGLSKLSINIQNKC